MYQMLTEREEEGFKKSRFVVFQHSKEINPHQADKPFDIFVGGVSAIIDKTSPILKGVYSEQDNMMLIKNLVSIMDHKFAGEQAYFRTFCDLVLKEFTDMALSRGMKALIIHTNDPIMLEILLVSGMRVVKVAKNFYKARRLLG
jgi:hypothetical protein